MVVQTKADARSVAGKPLAAGRKGAQQIAVDDDILDDQAVAAAIVDADQAEAAEAVVAQAMADGGILPTEAPIQSIGEVAQAPAPTTTDTTTTATTPAPVAEEASGLSPWAIGGIALGGIAGIALAASALDDDDDTPSVPPAGEPPAGPAPVNVAPTSPATIPVVTEADGTTALSAANFPFADADAGDALTSVRIGTVTATPVSIVPGGNLQVDGATGHGYELVAGNLTWEEASAAAAAKGGYLAVLDTAAEMAMVNGWYTLAAAGNGQDGTWIGASQAPGAATPDLGWTWVNGTPLDASAASPLWNNVAPGVEPNDGGGLPGEDGSENFAAIFDGTDPADTHLIYDAGLLGDTDRQAAYLIEYDTAVNSPLTLNGVAVTANQVIALDQLAGLTWNSVFNTGGAVTFAVGDNDGAYSTPDNTLTFAATVATDAGANQSISAMIEDQHLNVLA